MWSIYSQFSSYPFYPFYLLCIINFTENNSSPQITLIKLILINQKICLKIKPLNKPKNMSENKTKITLTLINNFMSSHGLNPPVCFIRLYLNERFGNLFCCSSFFPELFSLPKLKLSLFFLCLKFKLYPSLVGVVNADCAFSNSLNNFLFSMYNCSHFSLQVASLFDNSNLSYTLIEESTGTDVKNGDFWILIDFFLWIFLNSDILGFSY